MRWNPRVRAVAGHPIAHNVLSLGVAQVAITLVPLVTLPYLARVLDRSELGLVVFVQAFSFLVALVVEYGFNLSATRQVATARSDPAALARTVAGVLGAKAILAAGASLLSLAAWPLVPIFTREPELLGYGVVLGILQGFVPVWFFLGVERPQVVALVELTSRLAGLAMIVLLVKGAGDGELVLAIYAIGAAASMAVLTGLMFRRVHATWPTRVGSLEALRRGRALFVGTGGVALYTGANAFLLGLVVPAGQVALFAAAEKTVRAGNRVLALTSQAVYPRVSVLISRGDIGRANRLSMLTLLLFGGVGLAAGAALAISAPTVVEVVFGPRFEESVPLLRTLALLLPLNALAVALSTQWLLPRGFDRQVATITLAAAVLNAVLVMIAAEVSGLEATAWALVVVEVAVAAANLLVLRAVGARARP